jgi:hypothetical protein
MTRPCAAFGVTPSRGRHWPSGKANPAVPWVGAIALKAICVYRSTATQNC